MNDSDTQRTMEWMKKGFPNPIDKNRHTQLGVHFEEIVEMFDTIQSNDPYTITLIKQSKYYLEALSKELKNANSNIIEINDKIGFLDSLADQIVTAVGTGYVHGMDVAGAFGEVNRSNFSKFDKNGEPLLDNNLKLIKGPDYYKPNLEPYIKMATD